MDRWSYPWCAGGDLRPQRGDNDDYVLGDSRVPRTHNEALKVLAKVAERHISAERAHSRRMAENAELHQRTLGPPDWGPEENYVEVEVRMAEWRRAK